MKLSDKKILWFTNSPSLFLTKNDNVLGGWMKSMENMFRLQKINLCVAFHYDVKSLTKEYYNNNLYYLIPSFRHNSKITRYIRRVLNIIENQNFVLSNYKKIIDEFKPDIVQIWGTEFPYGLIIPHLKCSHVLHIQGNLTVYYKKQYAGITKKQLLNAATIKHWIKHDNFFLGEKRFKKTMQREQTIFANCKNYMGRTEWDKRIVSVLAPNKTYFHCDELLRNEFYNFTWSNPKNQSQFKITSVFRESIYKGIETIIESCVILNQLNFSVEWTIVGVDLKSNLYKLIKSQYGSFVKKLPINLVGKKNATDLLGILKESNLFVHPSHIDNSPNSICEAMIIGMPILTTGVGGIPSLVINNYSGYIIQDGDPYSMAGCILEIFNDYETAIKYGKNAQSAASDRHNPEKVFNQIIEIYKNLT